MKHQSIFFIMFIIMLLGAYPAVAQESAADVIVIDDANPVVELYIEPVPGTTGVVALDVYHAAISVADEMGNLLFLTVDPRVQTVELQSSPVSSAYTITVQQLAAEEQSFLRITGLSALTNSSDTVVVQAAGQTPVELSQEVDLTLSSTTPTENLNISLPPEEGGLISMSSPGANLDVQLTDTNGTIVATLMGDTFDGLSLGLSGGDYELVVMNPEPSTETIAAVSVIPQESNELAQLAASSATTVMTANTTSCSVTINASSVNLRSGPGTGYSILGYGYRNESLIVGGTNAGRNWYVVGFDGGSAWMAGGLGTTNGNCDALAIYNTPYRDAPVAEVVVEEVEPVIVQVQVPYSGGDGGGSSSSNSSSSSGGSSYNESSGHYDESSGDDNESSGSW